MSTVADPYVGVAEERRELLCDGEEDVGAEDAQRAELPDGPHRLVHHELVRLCREHEQ